MVFRDYFVDFDPELAGGVTKVDCSGSEETGLCFAHCHFALFAVKVQGEASAVVQKEQAGVWLYVAEACGEVLVRSFWGKAFMVYRANAEFVADAVFGAHEFGAAGV